MSKQTAVEWIFERINMFCMFTDGVPDEWQEALEQAKQMEKEVIMDAFQMGKWDGWQNHKLKANNKESQWTDPAQYYNETFNAKEK